MLAADQTSRFGTEAQMETHEVRLSQQRLERYMMRADRRRSPVIWSPSRCNDTHPERRSKRRDATSDRAESNEAERFSFELNEKGARPRTCAHATVHRWNLTRDRQHQRE